MVKLSESDLPFNSAGIVNFEDHSHHQAEPSVTRITHDLRSGIRGPMQSPIALPDPELLAIHAAVGQILRRSSNIQFVA